jgi:hypothetical protein
MKNLCLLTKHGALILKTEKKCKNTTEIKDIFISKILREMLPKKNYSRSYTISLKS